MRKLFSILTLLILSGSFIYSDDEKISVDKAIKLHKSGLSANEIIDLMKKTKSVYQLSNEDVEKLAKAGVPNEVIEYMKTTGGTAITTNELISWKIKDKLSDEDIMNKIINMRAKFDISSEDVLKLVDAGFDPKTIKKLKELMESGFKTVIIPGFKPHTHQSKLFVIQYPETWASYEKLDEEKFFTILTSERTDQIEEAIPRITIECSFVSSNHIYKYSSIKAIFEKHVRSNLIKFRDQSIKQEGNIEDIRAGKYSACTASYLLEKSNHKRKEVFLFNDELKIVITLETEKGDFDRHDKQLNKMLATFDADLLGSDLPSSTKLTSAQIVERYRESVVLVICSWEDNYSVRGSGFFIRKDGYILTNHHVVYRDDCPKSEEHGSLVHDKEYHLPKKIEIKWEDRFKRTPKAATVVGYHRASYPFADVALLKVDGEGYRSMPFASSKLVQEQQDVVALGFPAVLDSSTITTTKGAITKINLTHDETPNEYITDAEINPGNSGGPVFNIQLQGVVGIVANKYYDRLDTSELVDTGYRGIVPISTVLELFPEIYLFPENVKEKFSAKDYFNLGAILKNNKQYEPALRLLYRAIDLMDDYADAYALIGSIYLSKYNYTLSKSYSEKALKYESTNYKALLRTGEYYYYQGALDNDSSYIAQAVNYFKQAIQQDKNNYIAYVLRSKAYSFNKMYEEAKDDLQKAIELNQDLDAEPRLELGKLYYKMGQESDASYLEKGKEECEKAVKINPTDVEAKFSVADYYNYKKNIGAMEIKFEEILTEHKNDPFAHYWIGRHYYSKNSYERAYKVLEKGHRLYKNRRLVHFDCSYLYGSTAKYFKDYAKALEAFTWIQYDANLYTFIENNNDLGDLSFALGELFADLDKKGLAGSHFYIATKTSPQNETYKNKFEPLKDEKISLQDLSYISETYYFSMLTFIIYSSILDFDIDKAINDPNLNKDLRDALFMYKNRKSDSGTTQTETSFLSLMKFHDLKVHEGTDSPILTFHLENQNNFDVSVKKVRLYYKKKNADDTTTVIHQEDKPLQVEVKASVKTKTLRVDLMDYNTEKTVGSWDTVVVEVVEAEKK